MDTQEKMKKILVEWQEFESPKIYPRDFDYSLINDSSILSIIGPRRAGKTYLCYQIIKRLKGTIPSGNILYINFEDERLYPLKGNELTFLWDLYLELFPVEQDKKIYIILDEIQNIPNWSKWSRRMVEQNKNLKLIITGSSSKLFSKEIATELRGRTVSFVVYPLSFSEYLTAKNIIIKTNDLKNILYGRNKILVKKQFNSYAENGGFPAILESPIPEEILKDYYKAMFYRDLIDRYKVKNIKLLEDYLTLAIDQFGSLYSISSTAKKLEEFGHSLSKNTLSNFSRYAQEIFLIFETKKYCYKICEQIRSPKKIYAVDHGMIKAIRFFYSKDYGRILENIAFIALKRQDKEIYYHKGSRECDFIVKAKDKVIQAIQVCQTMADSKTRKREIEGLSEAMDQHKLKEGFILTENEYEHIKDGNKTVKVLPLWYWLLNSPVLSKD